MMFQFAHATRVARLLVHAAFRFFFFIYLDYNLAFIYYIFQFEIPFGKPKSSL